MSGRSADGQEELAGFLSLATLAAVFTIAIWAGSPMITKFGVQTVDTLNLAMLRTVGAIPFALAIIVFMRLRFPGHGSDKWRLLGVAVTSLIGFPVLFTLGVTYTTAGHAAVAQASIPVFAGLLDALVKRRWPSRKWWIGISVAFTGAVVLIFEAVGIESSQATWQGDLLVIGASFSGALSFVIGARLTSQYGAPSMTMWAVVVAGFLLLPILVFRLDADAIAAMDAMGWVAVVYLALGASVLAFIAWFYALSRGGVGRMSVWHFATPVLGVALAAAILGEPLTPLLVSATAVILLGVALVQRR